MTIEDARRSELEGTLDYIEGRWRDTDRATLKHGFALLARGRRVPPAMLAEHSGLSVETVAAALGSGPVGMDAQGSLEELFGVMLAPTMHRVEVEGRAVFACCALVAHALPTLLDRAATIESVDPVSRRVVKLRLRRDSLEDLTPSTAVASFPTTPSDEDLDDVREAFCSHLKHFGDRASADEFAAGNTRRRVLAVADMHELARQLVDRIWSA